MLNKNLLDTLETSDKEEFKKNLESLIERTFDLEKEFKRVQNSYQSLENVIFHIVQSQPNAIWILDEEKNIFLQNSEAQNIGNLIGAIDLSLQEQEIEFEHEVYLVKINHFDQKTVITATDITKQKRSERLTAMGKIAAHLSHEIRNPIGSISLLTSTLLRRVSTKEKPIVLEIQKAIYRVERIIKSTLLFAKGIEIERRSFSLQKLQNEIEMAFESYSISKEIHLKVEFPQKEIDADLDLLSLVMQNFLYNSIDAIEESEEEEGEVRFVYKEEKGFHNIYVYDSGIPIIDEKILYEPFKTTKTKGNGLGLALSLEIIKAHNGKIAFQKRPKGFKIAIASNQHNQKGGEWETTKRRHCSF